MRGEYRSTGFTTVAGDATAGVLSTPEFTTLYTSYTTSGAKSLLDALKAGVQIEQQDIADLATAMRPATASRTASKRETVPVWR